MIKTHTKQATIGTGSRVWFAYVNGQMLRGKNGIGRSFKTKEAAEKAANKAAMTAQAE